MSTNKMDAPVMRSSGPMVAPKPFTPKEMKKAMLAPAEKSKAVMRSSAPAPPLAGAAGAAATLLPENIKDGNAEEASGSPLLSENDARCYAARYGDLKGTAALTHFATIGVP